MYETIQELESKGLFTKAVRSGLIPYTLAGKKMIYEVYLKFRELGYKEGYGKTQAIMRTSIKTDTSETTIFAIIKLMEPQKKD